MNSKGKIIAAAAVGAAVGSVIAVLFAPDKGKHTRKRIKDKTAELATNAKHTIIKGKQKLASFAGADENSKIDQVEPIA